MRPSKPGFKFIWLLLALLARGLEGAVIQFAGEAGKLVLSAVSERTVRVELLRLDRDGRTQPPAMSTVLVSFAWANVEVASAVGLEHRRIWAEGASEAAISGRG